MKVCFSYIRFSSEGQRDGSSVERQSPIALKIATEKGWTLRNDLNASDLGVSAFKGDNIKTLRAIIQSAKDGKIPAGSVMILEAVDRLTRTDLDAAYDLFRDILKSGIEIYVDRGSRHFTKDSLKNPMDLMMAIMELNAANEYSAKLSDRVKAAYLSKSKKIMNGEQVKIGTLPNWIDDNFTLNGKASVVRSIFSSYLIGIGPGTIAKNLNQSNTPTLSGRGVWSQGVVYKLLSNRQVIGEYEIKSEIVKNYLPLVVTEETFMKVQSKLNDNRGKRPTTNTEGNIANLFSGVLFCGCGQTLKVTSGKNGRYMACRGKLNGLGCDVPMTKYAPLETSFVKLMTIRADDLVADESGNTVNNHIQILKGQLSEVKKEADHITSLGMGLTKRLAVRQAELERTEEELTRKLEMESAKTITVRGSSDRLQKIIAGLETLGTDNDLRVTVQGWIRENINRLTVNTSTKEYTVDLKNGNFVRMNFAGEVLECRSFVSLFTGGTVQDTVAVNQ